MEILTECEVWSEKQFHYRHHLQSIYFCIASSHGENLCKTFSHFPPKSLPIKRDLLHSKN